MRNIEQIRHLTNAGLKALVKGLIADIAVFGTVKKDGFPAWARLLDAAELELFQTPTHLSAKEFFFPQRETLLRFNRREGTHEQVIEADGQAVIGLHSCDIHAIALMDRVFDYGTPDANYRARREKTIIIGADCFPDEYCFCSSVSTMAADSGFDLFLHRINKGVLVRVGSGRGEDLLERYTNARPATTAQILEKEKREAERLASFKTRLAAPPTALPEIYAKSDESPVWDRIGAICYGCGSCNNVCPTCYCFDVKDEVAANLVEGKRVRVWDACTLARTSPRSRAATTSGRPAPRACATGSTGSSATSPAGSTPCSASGAAGARERAS